MKLGIMQPYFMPYIGYFQLMKAVDKYVVYDDVNFIKGGWINRNNILVNGEKKLFSIILKGASPNKLINEIEIGDDFKKLTKTLELNYVKAPYFKDIILLLERIFSFEDKQLSNFVANSFREILSYLNIDTEIIISSSLNKNCSLKGKNKVIHICKLLNADRYLNAIGGQELYSKDEFAENDIELSFLQTEIKSYQQFNNEFIPYLSIIDVLMFNSIEEVNLMLDNYTLI
jgi:hypothetical protein